MLYDTITLEQVFNADDSIMDIVEGVARSIEGIYYDEY